MTLSGSGEPGGSEMAAFGSKPNTVVSARDPEPTFLSLHSNAADTRYARRPMRAREAIV
jgi:hypothetical protein